MEEWIDPELCYIPPMALLAEELVEEWLNRQGYFTIRGIKIGVQEIDLLAVRFLGGITECRHIEVQASINPVSYITGVSKAIQKHSGSAPNSAKKRSQEELEECVQEWIHKKFHKDIKEKARDLLVPNVKWKYELVVNKIKHSDEIDVIKNQGIDVIFLSEIIIDLVKGETPIEGASGSDFVNLVLLNNLMTESANPVS